MKYVPVKYRTYGHTRSVAHYTNIEQPYAAPHHPNGKHGPRGRYSVSGYVSHGVREAVDNITSNFVRMMIREELELEIEGLVDNDLFYHKGVSDSRLISGSKMLVIEAERHMKEEEDGEDS